MWFLFVPLLIVLALLFLAGSLVAGIFGLLGAAWPLLLIGLGVWLFWHEDGSRRRDHRRWGRAQTPIAPMPPTAAPQRPDKRQRKVDLRPVGQPELPIDVQVKIEQIRRKVDVLLSYAERFPPFSQDLYLVRETASEYLPRTIDAYLALPRDAADKPVGSDGKTAHQELKAQLDLLDAKLDDIAQDLQRQDTDRLLANRRFLEDRFGMRETKSPAEAVVGAA
ncbi:MAG TPA: hypothetical protein VGQ62_08075 [Chloroflexota bacterium]|nr:hypothetical protein [Chloroflexota bacterium]